MDELAPSLRLAASGRGESDSSVSSETVGEGEATIVGRCTAAALGTGVDCVLDEEFSASREAARIAGFSKVRRTPPPLVSLGPALYDNGHAGCGWLYVCGSFMPGGLCHSLGTLIVTVVQQVCFLFVVCFFSRPIEALGTR